MSDPTETASGDEVAALRRHPSEVMRLARMGCSHPTRLSFLRQLLRRIEREGWVFDRPLWEIDARGVGRATTSAVVSSATLILAANYFITYLVV